MICAKCFVVFNNLDEIYATLCGHCFHQGCIANNCNMCPSCFQGLHGSFNFIKLNAIFENETHDKEKLKKVIEVREQNNFLKYQLHKTREDMQQMKNDLEKSKLMCAELKLDIEAERKMRRFHQLQLEGAITSSSHSDDRGVVNLCSDDEPAPKEGKEIVSKKVKENKTKKVIKKAVAQDCRSCKSGCQTRKCPCFRSSKGCHEKCKCEKCENRSAKAKTPKIKKVPKKDKKLPSLKVAST